MGKLLEMPKSQTQINQLWSGKPDAKRNQQEFDELFKGFGVDMDKVQEHLYPTEEEK